MTKIGYGAFWVCDKLETVTIGSSVTSIDEIAFEGCSSLKSVTIPNSVTTIGREAFYQCGLTSVTFGKSVKSIGKWAFYANENLKKITSKIVNPFDIYEEVFSEEIFSTATLYVPKGTVSKYKAKKTWQNFHNIKEEDTTTGIDDVETIAENKVGKYIENGKIVIVKNGKKYNLNGQAE